MRVARLKERDQRACYHVMSRVVDRQMVLGVEEKEKFRKLMRLVEGFSGVHVLTYAVMGNHFHLLLEVPERVPVSDEELLRRLRYLYSAERVSQVAVQLKGYREAGEDAAAEDLKSRYTYRMYDLSEYVKSLKQKYTQWHNRRHERRGTLWEERFKSVMIQSERAREGQWNNALLTMAAYIDLNALRAGIVQDPKDYRYCGYGEACGGSAVARSAYASLFAAYGRSEKHWRAIGALYRQQLFSRGEKTAHKAGFSPEEVRAVLDSGGTLPLRQMLRCRVRYFSDGVVLGSKSFVEDVYQRNREQFGLKRKSGARKLKQVQAGGLCTMRDLRMKVISPPSTA